MSTTPLATLLKRLRRDVQRARGGCGTDSDDDDEVDAPPRPPTTTPLPSWPRLASELLCLLREYPGGVADAVIRTHVACVLGSSGGGGRDGAAEEDGDDRDDGAAENGDDQDDDDQQQADLLLEPLAAVPDRRGGNFRRPAEGRASDLSADDPRAWVVVKGSDDEDGNGNANPSPAWLRLRRAATLAECLSEAARRSGPTERPMLLHARVERVAAAAGGRGGVGGGGASVAPVLPPPTPVLWLSDAAGGAGANASSSSSAMFVHTWHVPLLHAPSYLTGGTTPLLSTTADDANENDGPCRVRCAAVALKRGSLPTDMPPLMPPAAMALELGPGRFDRDVASQGRWLGDAVRWALEEELGGRGGRRGNGNSNNNAATLLPPAGVQLRGWVLARVASVSATERGSNATAAAASRTWTTRVVRLFCGGGGGGEGDDDAASLPLLLADAREALGDAFLPGETLAIWCPRLLRAPPGLSEEEASSGGLMLCFAEDAAPLVSQGGGNGCSNEPAATVSHVVVRGPEAEVVARCLAARVATGGGEKGVEEAKEGDEALLRSLREAAVLPLDALQRLGPSAPSIDSLPRRLVALGVVSGLRLANGGGGSGGNAGGDGAPSSSSSSFVHLRADLLDPQTGSSVPLSLSLRRDGRLLADLRDGHALLLCGARLVASPSSSSSSPLGFALEWAEAWSARADRAARGCDAQDLCAMPAALSTARVRALGGFSCFSSSSCSLAALLSLPSTADAPRPLFAVVKGLRLRALRAVVCRVHSACGRRVEALSAADMMGGSFDTEDDDQEGGGGGDGGGGLAALSLADKQEEEEKASDPESQARTAALAEWWRAWGTGQRRGRQGPRRFRVVLERATAEGGGSDDDDGSGDDDDEEDEDRLCSTEEEQEEEDEENKPPVIKNKDPFAAFKATQDKPEKKTTTTTRPLSFFSCAFCARELAVSGGANGGQSSNASATVSRAYRDDGLRGARMLLEDASLAAPLAADGVAWRAALGGVPASRAASGGRAARRACAAAVEAACSSESAGVTWDALLYWRGGEWRVAAMQVSVSGGADGEEEEEEGV